MLDLTDDEKRYERYIHVAMELLSAPDAGVSPSARALVERLGGSMTTANKAMRVFWRHVGRRLSYEQHYPAGMAPEVIKAMQTVMACARTAAAEELAIERSRVEVFGEQAAARVSALEKSLDELREELAQAQDQNQHLEGALTEHTTRLASAAAAAGALEESNRRLEQAASALAKDLSQAQTRLQELELERRAHKDELDRKNERIVRVEGMNSRLSERVEQSSAKEKALGADLDSARSAIRSLEDKARVLQDGIAQRQTALATSEAAAAEAQRYTHKLEAALEEVRRRREQLEERVVARDAELAALRPLRARCRDLERQVSDLMGERDRLLALLEAASRRASETADRGPDRD